MKYIWYGFLGLFSLGCLGFFFGVASIFGVFHYYGSQLPAYDQLKTYEPPIVSRVYAGDGRLMAEFAQEKRVFIPIESIPEKLKQAFIATEDQNFYTHEGVDPTALMRAVFIYAQHLIGRNVSVVGGSTITQQVVKNMLLTNERSFERKIKEAILASRLEKALTKDRILELYLNEIFLGYRSYGVAAAALQYFDKSLDELSIAEMAYLAALPKAPNNYHPIRNTKAAITRRNWVIKRMEQEGYITKEEEAIALQAPLETAERAKTRTITARYFAEEIRRELENQYGEDSLYGGGLAVRSTIDPKLQSIAENTLQNGLMAYDMRHGYRGPLSSDHEITDNFDFSKINKPSGMLDNWQIALVTKTDAQKASLLLEEGGNGTIALSDLKWAREYLDQGYARGPEIQKPSDAIKTGDIIMVAPKQDKENAYELRQIPDVQGAVLALDPHTGRILAMQGGWKYETSVFNRATQAKRQPGSAFKPFVYLAALEHGFTPATLVLDGPFVIEDRPGHFWSPTNYSNEYYGPTPIRVGVEKSKNLMTVRLADYLGMDMMSDYAKRFGIDENMPPMLSNSLGASETTLLNITSAYGVLVNGGKKITPTIIDRIQDRYGETIFRHDDRSCTNCGNKIRWEDQPTPALPENREQLADPRAAYQMVSILEGVVERGTGVRIKSLGRPLAGKTGTTNESKDTWFIGFSPDLVVGVFVGFDEPRSLGRRETGSSVAVPIFKDFMAEALKDEPIKPFRIPDGIRNVQINAETGARAKPGDEKVIWEAFQIGTEPTENMYILDGTGINILRDFDDYNYLEDVKIDPENIDPNQPFDYNSLIQSLENNEQPQAENEPETPPINQRPRANTGGTGGFY